MTSILNYYYFKLSLEAIEMQIKSITLLTNILMTMNSGIFAAVASGCMIGHETLNKQNY